MGKADTRSTTRDNRSICLPFTQDAYNQNIKDPVNFRKCINERIEFYPELFPAEISDGYKMKDSHFSKKLLITVRRIEIAGIAHTIRPSFAMPYMTGIADEIENAIFFRKFGVPFWAISHVFGKDAMYWFRIEQTIGRNSIVGAQPSGNQTIYQDILGLMRNTPSSWATRFMWLPPSVMSAYWVRKWRKMLVKRH